MKYIGFTLMLALGSTGISAQPLDARTISKIKVKFINANNFFEAKDYDKALQKISEVETLLGKPSATALNLKIKIMVARGQFVKAEQALDKLYSLSPNGEVLEDIAVYSTIIEKNIDRARRRIETEQLAQKQRDKKAAEYAEQQRIIRIEKDKKEAIEKKKVHILKKGCELQSAESCFQYASILDASYSKGFYEKACHLNHEKSCDYLIGLRHVVRIEPRYPRKAALAGVEGWVKLSFTINEYGGVADVNVIEAYPKDIFNKAAMRALVKWKYKPKIVNGIALKQTNLTVQIDFKMN